ncbi:hypothetical protein LTS15_002566 [Exophiala xenobiotica]|nr:hypothetical protein LTS15_002566 [Exophiala xenobiotica]
MGAKSGVQVPTTDNASGLRRPKAPVACVVCKSRRIRCSGTAPCQACLSLGTQCVIDETLDGRRKVALTRKLAELVHYKWIMEGFLICLRFSRGPYLVDLLECVSGGVPLRSLATTICAGLSKADLPGPVQSRVIEIQRELKSYINGNPQPETYSSNGLSRHSKASAVRDGDFESPSGTLLPAGKTESFSPQHQRANYRAGRSDNDRAVPKPSAGGTAVDTSNGYHASPFGQLADHVILTHSSEGGLDDILQFLNAPRSPSRHQYSPEMNFEFSTGTPEVQIVVLGAKTG